ncbi:hypothetical protein [Flavonifractor sp. An92]|uniref:hypothetical protein n=1 Tax=Flavonifractor sp. An92 TaxID=1965666 RepID=UPI001302267F|nr:hypothetical protein [Flavonifractor sp. An92]
MAVSARYTKGITIEIGGNATKLKTALDGANRSIRTTQSELDTLRNSLKLEWDPSQFQRAQELARRAVEETEQKAQLLRKALETLGDPSGFSQTQREQYEALRRELSYAEVAARGAREELTKVNRLQFTQLEEQARAATQALEDGLEDADAALDNTRTRLELVRKKLEQGWDTEDFRQAQALAAQAVEETERKAELLRQKLAALEETGTERTCAAYQRLDRELAETESAARDAQEELTKINRLQFTQLEEQARAAAQALEDGLEDADAALDNTNTRLELVQKKLEQGWDAKRFDQAQELAQRAISQTEAKAELLRQKLAALEEAGTEQTSAEYQRLEKQLLETEQAAEQARERLQSINQLQLDHLNQGLAEAARRLTGAGTALTAGVTAPLTAAGVAAVRFSSDTQEAINKVEVAFGSAADRVKDWSDTTLTSYGLARGTALDLAALFGDLATSMGFSQDAAADMAMQLVALAGDLASFKNVGVDQAMNALKGIFTGETESLKELGVVMTQANVEAWALEQGIEASYDAMTQAEKVALQYQYVLAMTANAQGDFARTGDSTANQLRILQESAKELAASFGGELLEVVTPVVEGLNGLVQSFADLDEGSKRTAVQVALFAAALGPALTLTGGLNQAVSAGVGVYQTLRTSLTAATAAQAGLNAAMSANPVGAVVTAVSTLAAVLGAAAVSAALTRSAWQDTVEQLRQAEQAALDDAAAKKAQLDALRELLPELEALNSQSARTGEEQSRLNGLVAVANELYPGLIGQVDALTGAYDINTQAIERTIDAMERQYELEAYQDILAEKYQAIAQLKVELAQAEQDLAEAVRESEAAQQAMNDTTDDGSFEALTQNYLNARSAAQAQADTVEALKGRITGLEGEARELLSTTAGLTGTLEEQTGALTASGAAAGEASARLAELNGVLERTQGACELLAQAQREQSEAGYLELDTVAKLLAEYPQLAPYLVEAADGYQLADGALQDYIATQRAAYEVALNDAQRAADAIVSAEADKINALNQTTASAQAQLTALANLYQSMGANAENAAEGASYYTKANEYRAAAQELEEAAKSLATFDRVSASYFRSASTSSGKKSTTTSSRGGSSSSTAAKEKTPAELELEAYRAAVEELDHQRAMDLIREETYYQRKAALGEQYLKNNRDERWKLDEELYTWQSGAYERDLQALREALDAEEITWEEYLKGLAQARTDHLTEGGEAWQDALRTEAEEEQALREEAYQEQLEDLQYFLDLDLISEAEFHTRKAALRDQYLAENSKAWKDATVELYQWQKEQREQQLKELEEQLQERLDAAKEAYEAQTQALEDQLKEEKELLKEHYDDAKAQAKEAYEAEKQAAKEAYDARVAQIQAQLEAEEERLNAVLEGIDAEIQARRELREDEEQDDAIAAARKRLEAAQAQLAYARDEEQRLEWEKEVQRLQEALDQAIQDKEDTAFYREKEEEKEAVQDQLEEVREEASAAKDAAKAEYDAALERLESAYDARLEGLEEEYQSALAQLEEDYQRRLAEAEEDYDRRVEALRDRYENGGTAQSGGGTAAPAVDLDKLGTVLGAVASGLAAVGNTITQTITNHRSANLTYQVTGGMTEGQVARTVRKTLEELDR